MNFQHMGHFAIISPNVIYTEKKTLNSTGKKCKKKNHEHAVDI